MLWTIKKVKLLENNNLPLQKKPHKSLTFHRWGRSYVLLLSYVFISLALESLGFGSYISEVKEVLQECKTVALKRRKASSRLENLGIPEEELLRQQQELFAKVSNHFKLFLSES